MNKEVTILRTSRKGIEIEVIENEVSGVKWNIDTTERDKQIRADTIDELFDKAFDVDMDSSLIYIKFDREKFGNPFFKYKCDLKNWFTEQLKEQNAVH